MRFRRKFTFAFQADIVGVHFWWLSPGKFAVSRVISTEERGEGSGGRGNGRGGARSCSQFLCLANTAPALQWRTLYTLDAQGLSAAPVVKLKQPHRPHTDDKPCLRRLAAPCCRKHRTCRLVHTKAQKHQPLRPKR